MEPNINNIDMMSVPAKAINMGTLDKICRILNIEQPLLSRDKVPRDYRGLAQQMGLLCEDIQYYKQYDNPTFQLFNLWTRQENATIGKLIEYLEYMQRFHIIQDFQDDFKKDAEIYTKSTKQIQKRPFHPKVPCADEKFDTKHNYEWPLTIQDQETGGKTIYNAYVSYADNNFDFVAKLTAILENRGFLLCIRKRDLLAGHDEYGSISQLIQTRCKHVLLILSPDFIKSPICQFEVKFAASVQFTEEKRKLVPIVLEDCDIPPLVQCIAKVDFRKLHGEDWLWNRIITSIQDSSCEFVSQDNSSHNLVPKIEIPDDDNPRITFPPTTAPLSNSTSIKEIENKQNKKKGKRHRSKILQMFKNKSSIGEPSTSDPSISNVSSGFFSKSDTTSNVKV